MAPSLILRLAGRELRAGVRGFRVFLLCLTLGVGAIAGVGSTGAAITAGLGREARTMLGGDLAVELGQRPLSAAERGFIERRSAAASRIVEMRAMAGAPDGEDRRMVELKAVDGAYPLVGALSFDPPMSVAEAIAPRGGVYGAAVDEILLARLGLNLGESLAVGEARFELRAVLRWEPDRAASVVSFGPRVLIAEAALGGTGLVQPGSQIRYALRALLPKDGEVAALASALKTEFPEAGWRLRDIHEAAPGVRRYVERMTLFFAFAGLTALLVGGVGVGNAVQGYLESRTATLATMKCLGASGGLVVAVHGVQVALLSLLGMGLGLMLGAAVPLLALDLLKDLLPVPAVGGLYARPLLLAAAFGALSTLTFALGPLLGARRVAPAVLFRGSVDPAPARLRNGEMALVVLSAAGLAILVLATAGDKGFALWFVGGTAAIVLVLRLGAGLVRRWARGFGRDRRPAVRLGIANLHRPGNRTAGIMLSMGLALSVLVAVAEIEGNLRHQIDERLPQQAPAFFFVDIQSEQAEAFDAALREIPGAGRYKRVPTLRGRITAIAGVPADAARIAPDAAWAVNGDRALTYGAAPPEGAEIVAGRWWPSDYRGPPQVSLDAGLARGFGIGLGDTLTVNVLGRPIEATVTSLREIDWRSLRFDFALIFSPGVLEGAPQSHIAAIEARPDAEAAINRTLAQRFPGVTAIRVREALEAARMLVDGVGAAVRAAASIALVAGVLVLGGAVAAGHRRRVYDAVVFKVLGATRRMVLGAYVMEYGVLGLATGTVAAAVGTLVAWAVMVFLMKSAWVFLPGVALAAAGTGILAALIGGIAGTWIALGRKAAPLLRNA